MILLPVSVIVGLLLVLVVVIFVLYPEINVNPVRMGSRAKTYIIEILVIVVLLVVPSIVTVLVAGDLSFFSFLSIGR